MDQLKLWEGEEEDISVRHTSLSKEKERQERAQSIFRDQISEFGQRVAKHERKKVGLCCE